MPFFTMGLILSHNLNIFIKHKKTFTLIFTTLFIISCILLFDSSKLWANTIKHTKIELLNLHFYVISEYLLLQFERFITGILGALMIISLIFCVTPFFSKCKSIHHIYQIGRETLGIYIIQTLLLEAILPKVVDLSNINVLIFTFILTPLISLIMLYVCYYISISISKSSYLRKIFFL